MLNVRVTKNDFPSIFIEGNSSTCVFHSQNLKIMSFQWFFQILSWFLFFSSEMLTILCQIKSNQFNIWTLNPEYLYGHFSVSGPISRMISSSQKFQDIVQSISLVCQDSEESGSCLSLLEWSSGKWRPHSGYQRTGDGGLWRQSLGSTWTWGRPSPPGTCTRRMKRCGYFYNIYLYLYIFFYYNTW